MDEQGQSQVQKLSSVFMFDGVTKDLDWNKVSFIIWDLDGVLCPDDDVADEITVIALNKVFGQFLADQGLDVDPDFLNYLANQVDTSERFEDKPLFKAFEDQVDISQFMTPEYHAKVHEALIETARSYGLPAYCEQTVQALGHLDPIQQQYILTHSSKLWAEYVLGQLRLPGFQTQDNVYDYERVGFKSKADGPQAFLQICEEHGLDPSRGLFIDNTYLNLIKASELGFQTILILNEKDPLPADTAHVTAQFKSAMAVGDHYRLAERHQHEDQLSKAEIEARGTDSPVEDQSSLACASQAGDQDPGACGTDQASDFRAAM